MLIPQAQSEDLPIFSNDLIISNDRIFDAYGVRRIW